jgi:hypothetical protein
MTDDSNKSEQPLIFSSDIGFTTTKTAASEIREALTDVLTRCVKDGVAPAHIAYDIEQAFLMHFGVNLTKVVEAQRGFEQPPVMGASDILEAAIAGIRLRLGKRLGSHSDSIVGPGVAPNCGFSVTSLDDPDDWTRYELTVKENKPTEKYKESIRRSVNAIMEKASSNE